MKRYLSVLALCAFFVPAAILAGCGGVPGNAVAEVDGTADREGGLRPLDEHRREVQRPAERRRARAAGLHRVRRRRAQEPAQAGQGPAQDRPTRSSRSSASSSTTSCATRCSACSSPSSGSSARPRSRASRSPTPRSRRPSTQQKKQSFPKEADYQKFLKDSGQTEEDILQRVRLELLSNKIREKVTKGKDKVTDAQVEAYYDKNKAQLRPARAARPEHRAAPRPRPRPSRPSGARERRVVQDGRQEVLDRRRVQGAGRQAAGRRQGPAGEGVRRRDLRGQEGRARPARSRRQFGYYVFEVDKVTKATQQTLEEATPTIKQLLAAQNQQKALRHLRQGLREEVEGARRSAARASRRPDCKNGPKATPTPTPGAAQQQAPQATATPAPE